jgi:hypothetical protein
MNRYFFQSTVFFAIATASLAIVILLYRNMEDSVVPPRRVGFRPGPQRVWNPSAQPRKQSRAYL